MRIPKLLTVIVLALIICLIAIGSGGARWIPLLAVPLMLGCCVLPILFMLFGGENASKHCSASGQDTSKREHRDATPTKNIVR